MIKINCSGCDKSYSYDEEMIPQGKTLDLPCPACKTVITIMSGNVESESNPINGAELFKNIIKTSKALPPMPEIMEKATAVLSDDNAGYKEVGEILETDQAMATRVLKLANSAYYGLSVPVESVQQASALLGFQTLIELVTVVSTSQMMGKSLKGYNINSKEMWEHSLLVATAAKKIAEKTHPELVGSAFNAGLIHDSGMIIIDEYIEKNKDTFLSFIENGDPIHSAEKKLLGFNHSEIASEFFKKWKLPPSQTRAIKYHHHPDLSDNDPLSKILHIADFISMSETPERNYSVNESTLASMGLEEGILETIFEETKAAVGEIILSIHV